MKQSIAQQPMFDEYIIIKLDLIAGAVRDLRSQMSTLSTALEALSKELEVIKGDVERKETSQ